MEFLSAHPQLVASIVTFLVASGTLLTQLAMHVQGKRSRAAVAQQLHEIHVIVNDRTDKMMAEIKMLRHVIAEKEAKEGRA